MSDSFTNLSEEALAKLEQDLEDGIKEKLTELYNFPEKFTVSLLKYSENVIYKIDFDSLHEAVVFRIHRPGYHNLEELESEMIWMDEILRDTDICLPKVYKGRDGKVLSLLTLPDGRTFNCSVISFLEGQVLGNIEGEELFKAIEEMGEITAKLHVQSINRDKSIELKRFSWDIKNLFEEDGVWGSWRDYPGLDAVDRQVLSVSQDKIVRRLKIYGRSQDHYGLIHADLHFYNIIRKDGVNQIFDFDDCGYGFFLYDLGCTLVTYSKDLKSLTRYWLRGYERIRRLTEEERELLPMFILLRRIVRLGWLASHWDSDTRKTVGASYLTSTVQMARSWCFDN